jgi:dTDP-4-amino-4,6-dideoxy-D-glucose acyltransferase
MKGYYSEADLYRMGIEHGENVLISEKASIIHSENIICGDNVRIDDFCYISMQGKLYLDGYNHIAAHCLITGKADIHFEKYSAISGGGIIYSSSDDYSGKFMSNPTVPEKYLKVYASPIQIGKHVLIGAGCKLMPGVVIGDGCSFGMGSVLRGGVYKQWVIYAGVPAKRIKERKRDLLLLEEMLNEEERIRNI